MSVRCPIDRLFHDLHKGWWSGTGFFGLGGAYIMIIDVHYSGLESIDIGGTRHGLNSEVRRVSVTLAR